MTYRALNARGELAERAFQGQVVGLARMYRWQRIYHAPAGGHRDRVDRQQLPEGKGFPDLILIKLPRLVVAELKTRTGRIAPEQREWLDVFAALGAEAYLWRPADWDEIHDTLRAGQVRRCDLDPIGGPECP